MKGVVNIIKIFDEQTKKNILISLGLHLFFSFGFWVSFLYLHDQFLSNTLWVDMIGWVSYLVVGIFIKVSERNIQNIISVSFISIIGILFWILLFSIYVQEINNAQSISWFGPVIIWFFYLPYVHGSYFILNLQDVFQNDYLIAYILLLNNVCISVILYLIIKVKQRLKKLKMREPRSPIV